MVPGDVTPTSFRHQPFDATLSSGQSVYRITSHEATPPSVFVLCCFGEVQLHFNNSVVPAAAILDCMRSNKHQLCSRRLVHVNVSLFQPSKNVTQELAFLTETQFLYWSKGEELV